MPTKKKLAPNDRRPSADGTATAPARPARRRHPLAVVIAALAVGVGVPILVLHAPLGLVLDGGPRMMAPPTPITYWPDASSTGVPPGTVLRPSGSLSLRTAGQVVSNLDITGCVSVWAINIQILRSRIRCNNFSYAIRTYPDARNLLVQDVEIDGGGNGAASVCCANYTLRRVNIHNSIDGPRLSDNSTVEDSYIHDLARVTGSHNDALQTTGGVGMLIRRNTLLPYRAATNDPCNACLMLGSETAPAVRNLLMVDNYCNGGNWSIGIRADLVASNVVFRANKFGRNFRYGVVARPRHPGITWEASNVFFDNGVSVVR